ncbi:MAG: cytidine deaminase [Acidimicrobiia bacterium]|nr:cytidine deaminase [Acidimicrobiia bacterium]
MSSPAVVPDTLGHGLDRGCALPAVPCPSRCHRRIGPCGGSVDISELIEAALVARQRAYAPYSGFRMGAAVRSTSGTIVTGALVENVSLGLAMCAERVALFATIASGERPTALVVASPRTSGALTFPCGACLQVGLELGGRDLMVVAVDPDGTNERAVLGDLLPRGPHKA